MSNNLQINSMNRCSLHSDSFSPFVHKKGIIFQIKGFNLSADAVRPNAIHWKIGKDCRNMNFNLRKNQVQYCLRYDAAWLKYKNNFDLLKITWKVISYSLLKNILGN